MFELTLLISLAKEANQQALNVKEQELREKLIQDMQKAIDEMQQWPRKEVQVFHHNDSDGLSSGAILTRTLERAGFRIKRFCLEKPYPALLQKVYAQEDGIIIFADFAGRIAPVRPEPGTQPDPDS